MAEKKSVSVLIVDDHSIVREGLRSLLEKYEEFEIIGEAKNGKEAIAMDDKFSPDVIFMDVLMPEKDGIEATKIIKEKHPKTQVIMLSISESPESVLESIKAGASSYIGKDVSLDYLVQSVKEARNPEKSAYLTLSSKKLRELISTSFANKDYNLTIREIEILQLVADGYHNRKIAQKLNISLETVKKTVSNIFQKLSASDRAEAVAIALRRRLIH